MVNRVPIGMRSRWSFFEKSGVMTSSNYVDIIKKLQMVKAIGKNSLSLLKKA